MEDLKGYLRTVLEDQRYLKILYHLKKANVDYGKSIMLDTKIPLNEIVNLLNDLERMGLIERVMGATLKNTEAKFKLSHEVHKHHTYYTLTRSGDHLLRHISQGNLTDEYIELLRDDKQSVAILEFAEKLNADHALTYAKLIKRSLEETMGLLERLVRMGLLEEKNSRIIKFRERKAKPKKETRTHHKYYGLTRLGELIVREMKRRGIIAK